MTGQDQQRGVELEASSEKPVRLRASVIVTLSALVAGVIMLTMIYAFSPREKRRAQDEYAPVMADVSAITNEPLSLLPKDYDQLPPEEPVNQPLPLEQMQAPQAGYEMERKHAEDLALEEKALASGLFFDGSVSNHSLASLSQTNIKGSALPEIPSGLGNSGSDYTSDLPPDDRQNLQDQKIAFLQQVQGADEFVLRDRLHTPLSPYEVKAGTLIPAVLITAINSDLPGDVIAQVSEHVYDSVTGRFILIPQGAKLYGRYDSVISYGQERALVSWQRLVMPNGKSISLSGMVAADTAGMSGLEDQVDHHYMRLAGAVLLSTAISLSGNLANDDDDDSFGNDVGDTVAQEASRVGQRYVSKAMNIQPTIKIRGGAEVRVFVNKDMILEPYEGL